jgi:hypothetical protein
MPESVPESEGPAPESGGSMPGPGGPPPGLGGPLPGSGRLPPESGRPMRESGETMPGPGGDVGRRLGGVNSRSARPSIHVTSIGTVAMGSSSAQWLQASMSTWRCLASVVLAARVRVRKFFFFELSSIVVPNVDPGV